MYLEKEIINVFDCKGEIQALAGGQGQSVRVGDCVFKPIDNADYYEWCCSIIDKTNSDTIRISKPKKCIYGKYTYKGWGVTQYEEGYPIKGKWDKKIEVARIFNKALSKVKYSKFPESNDPWTLAHQIAWREKSLPDDIQGTISKNINDIIASYREVRARNQMIHSDLCGNILFHESESPLVIDFSPALRPAAYAEAILVTDAVAWEAAPTDIICYISDHDNYEQFLLRAVCFRLCVLAIFNKKSEKKYFDEYKKFIPLLKIVT